MSHNQSETNFSEMPNVKDYISNQHGHITVNMLKKNCGIQPKHAFRVLKANCNTMICDPLEFGSNKNTNEKLYKKVSDDEIKTMCKDEIDYMNKNKIVNDSNIKQYIYSSLPRHMMEKFRISLSSKILREISESY